MLESAEAESNVQAGVEERTPEHGRPPAGPRESAEEAWTPVRSDVKALSKAERRAAKNAARLVAALEKKEARERKALAKAAARRKRWR